MDGSSRKCGRPKLRVEKDFRRLVQLDHSSIKEADKELCDFIENFSLVNFSTLDIQDKESVGNLVKLIDKFNGYICAGIDASAAEFTKIAVGPVDFDYYRVAAVQAKYVKDDDNFDLND